MVNDTICTPNPVEGVTSQDKSQDLEVKIGHQWIYQIDGHLKYTVKIGAKWFMDDKFKRLEWLSQRP